jgi:hypothetical protein
MSDPPPTPRQPRSETLFVAGFLILLVLGVPLLFWAGSAVFGTGGSGSSGSSGGFDVASPLPPPPPPADYGTAREIGTRGDSPNPRALYHGAYPSNDQTQERRIGGPPARFSGYTTWVRAVARVPARTFVDGYAGDYLRVKVTVFNRDVKEQSVCACDFYVYTRRNGPRVADVVAARTLAPDTMMKSGARLDGNVYLYVGKVAEPFFIVYDPDGDGTASSEFAKGVWRFPAS